MWKLVVLYLQCWGIIGCFVELVMICLLWFMVGEFGVVSEDVEDVCCYGDV